MKTIVNNMNMHVQTYFLYVRKKWMFGLSRFFSASIWIIQVYPTESIFEGLVTNLQNFAINLEIVLYGKWSKYFFGFLRFLLLCSALRQKLPCFN